MESSQHSLGKANRNNNAVLNFGVTMCILLLLSILILIAYNKQKLVITSTANKTGKSILSVQTAILYHGLGDVDKDLRGLAIAKDSVFLKRIESHKLRSMEHLTQLASQIAEQSAEFPEFKNSLDSIGSLIPELRKSLITYYAFCDEIANYSLLDSTNLVKEMIAQDKGMSPWKIWDTMDAKLNRIENRLLLSSANAYDLSNIWLYVSIVAFVIVGIPTGLLFNSKVRKSEKAKKDLLNQLDKTNLEYLFNSGHHVNLENDEKRIIETTIENLKYASSFVTQLSENNFDKEWPGMTAENAQLNTNNLSGRLIKLSENLKSYKAEEVQRNWLNEGLSKFSLLVRNNQQDIERLADEVIKYLVKYVGAVQAGLFVVNKKNNNLELKACYAYERKKYLTKEIQFGEGLLGQTYLEKETVLILDLPEKYVTITSGLGQSGPRSLLVIPFKSNDEIEAVFEIASFETWPKHKISFLEKAGEFVALALISARTSEEMKSLLEASQQQTEYLRSAEEELRQNMEEMQAIQEANARSLAEVVR